MGHLCAKVLPDWGFTFRGKRHSLNPGPWTVKEQLLATIIQSAAGTGNYGGLLALRMPQFFNQVSGGSTGTLTPRDGSSLASRSAWASRPRFGAAGLLRRLTVYPVQAVWPQSLPTLALVRTLIHSDPRCEVVSSWRISRWLCFILSAIVFGLWYWFPNNIMVAFQRFDWMCWIAPRIFNVNIVTGAYGGMRLQPDLNAWPKLLCVQDDGGAVLCVSAPAVTG